ncbi:MAG: PEP-CTERM sorting domain-containing protein [Thermodesulfobacteriota bacterium]|nr:PEP-CTERM sorting domain-containing protein [Thermodesulfobacteriota bacterium]
MKKLFVIIAITATLLLSLSHQAFTTPIIGYPESPQLIRGEITNLDFYNHSESYATLEDFYAIFNTCGIGDEVIFSYEFYPKGYSDLYGFKYSLSFGCVTIENTIIGSIDPNYFLWEGDIPFGSDNPYFTKEPSSSDYDIYFCDPNSLVGDIANYTYVEGFSLIHLLSTDLKSGNDTSFSVGIDFIATEPVPEPTTWVLLMSGLLGLYRFRNKLQ